MIQVCTCCDLCAGLVQSWPGILCCDEYDIGVYVLLPVCRVGSFLARCLCCDEYDTGVYVLLPVCRVGSFLARCLCCDEYDTGVYVL